MEKTYLKENYKEFANCYSDSDFIAKADDLNTSREYCYEMADGTGTYDVTDVMDLLEKQDGGYYTCDGYIRIEVTDYYGDVVPMTIPVEITLEEWDEEDQVFGMESVSVKDVEEW